MTDTPQLLLVHHLKTLKLPTFLREYDKLAHEDNEPGSCYATPRIHPSTLAALRSGGVRFGSRNPARLPSFSAHDNQAAME